MQYVALDRLINLYDGYRQVFEVNRHEILLMQHDGQRYAIQASCPHRQWPLQHAPVQGRQIVCSKHGWAFDLHTGRAANQRASCDLKPYRVCYQDTTIGILLETE